MRVCMVKGRKAMFHNWEQVSETILSSPKNNEHKERSTLRYTAGIVEYEDGSVERVAPNGITFQDTRKLLQKVECELTKWEMKQVSSKETVNSVQDESRLSTPDKAIDDASEDIEIKNKKNTKGFFGAY